MQPKVIPLIQATQSSTWVKTSLQVLFGTLYIALLSQVEIPLTPVPVTMQTFAIFSLALFQGSKKSSLSILAYLLAATIGLPVLSGASSNPLWMLAPYAGYCVGFLLAAYLIGKCTEMKNSSVMWTILGLCLGQVVIYSLGVMWLSFLIGFDQALMMGLYPFILFDSVKLLAAFSAKMAAKPGMHYFKQMMK